MNDNHYPFNLIRKIYGDDKHERTHTETTYIKGLYEQLKTLTKDEQILLAMRYRDGLMIQTCAERFGITPQQVSKIINSAMRKLRSSWRTKHFEAVPKAEYLDLKRKYQEVSDENENLKEALRVLDEHEVNPQTIILLASTLKLQDLNAHISELNLSTRAFNGLRRAGIFTIKDLIAVPDEELTELESIGKKTAEEIRYKIKAHIFRPDLNQHDEKEVDNS